VWNVCIVLSYNTQHTIDKKRSGNGNKLYTYTENRKTSLGKWGDCVVNRRWAMNIQFTNLPIIKFKIWTFNSHLKNTVADYNLNPFNERQCRTTWTAKTLFGLKRWLVRRRSRSRAINDQSTSTTILCRHENCMLQRSGENGAISEHCAHKKYNIN